jgi:hypothetical protein
VDSGRCGSDIVGQYRTYDLVSMPYASKREESLELARGRGTQPNIIYTEENKN